MTTDLPDLSETLRWVRGHADAVRDPVTSEEARRWHTTKLLERVDELDTWLCQRVHVVALPRDWDRAVQRDARGTDRVRANDATHPRELPEPDPFVDLVRRVLEALDAEGYYVPLPLPPFVDAGSVAAFLGLVRRPQGAGDDDRHATVATLEAAITAGELVRRRLNGGL